MSALALGWLMLGLGSVVSLLGWIGWRFFVLPVGASGATLGLRGALGLRQRVVGAQSGSEAGGGQLGKVILGSVVAVVLVGGLAVGGVFSISDRIAPDALAVLEWDRQLHIQGVLNPERLVPPPALPPALFVNSERPALETADRDWSRLNPGFTQPVLRILSRLASRGYTFALLEGYRSPERQEMLADLGSHVTNARAFQSKHQYGVAVDLAPVRDGKLVISERDPWAMEAYVALGEEAEKEGLTWGGRWWFKDFGHVEMSGSISEIARFAH